MGSLFPIFSRLGVCVGVNFFLLWPMELLNLVGDFSGF
jgi:hypothetical protein